MLIRVEESRHLAAGFTQGTHNRLAFLCAATTFVRDHYFSIILESSNY
jgi:hypothetical protein